MGLFIQMTGLSGAGKSTLANAVAKKLLNVGYKVEVIDGDEYRTGLCSDLGFSKKDRNTNIRRLAFVGKILARNDVVAIMSAINPYEDIRQEVSKMGDFVKTVYIKCDIATLRARDTKGLYRKAFLPDSDPEKIYNLTGVSDPFDEPANPDLVIETNKEELIKSVDKLYDFIWKEQDKTIVGFFIWYDGKNLRAKTKNGEVILA